MQNIASKQIQWILNKALPDITLSKQSIVLDSDNLTDTFLITTNSDGNLSVISSDTSIATVSLSGNTVTVTALVNGTCTITVSISESTDGNYLSDSKELSVTCNLLNTTLNDNSWSTISNIAQAGTASNYWSVGDCKEITLNGKVGDYLTLTNEKLCVFILDFNHPTNGVAENNIIFGGFKTALANGTDVILVDGKCGSALADGTICFNLNHWGNYTHGGWKGCDLRYDVLGATNTPPSDYGSVVTAGRTGYDATAETLTNPKANTMLAALPSDLRSNMRLWTRYVDAIGNASNIDANIKATVDAITLLAEPEVFTKRSYANQYEYNHNTRMTYYVNGNSTIKKKHTDGATAYTQWESSPRYNDANRFCAISAAGGAAYSYINCSHGFALAFKI